MTVVEMSVAADKSLATGSPAPLVAESVRQDYGWFGSPAGFALGMSMGGPVGLGVGLALGFALGASVYWARDKAAERIDEN